MTERTTNVLLMIILVFLGVGIFFLASITIRNSEQVDTNSNQSKQNFNAIRNINATLRDFVNDRNIAFNETFQRLNNIANQTDINSTLLYLINDTQVCRTNAVNNLSIQHDQILDIIKNIQIILINKTT